MNNTTNYQYVSFNNNEPKYNCYNPTNTEYDNLSGRGIFKNPLGNNQISNVNFTKGQSYNCPKIMLGAHFPTDNGKCMAPPQELYQIPYIRNRNCVRN